MGLPSNLRGQIVHILLECLLHDFFMVALLDELLEVRLLDSVLDLDDDTNDQDDKVDGKTQYHIGLHHQADTEDTLSC